MVSSFRRFLAEPRPGGAPRFVWRDPVLVVVFMIAIAIELSLRDVPWRIAFMATCLPLPLSLLYRRTQPLLAIATFIVPLTIFDIALAIGGHELPDVPSLAFGVILIYAAFRWGSGREAIWSAILLLGGTLVDFSLGFTTFGDTIAGFAILGLIAETGVVIRRNRSIREMILANARSTERERLARELHDTIAHHVSAIAVQAQAGRAVMASNPDMAATTFDAIEESASRALAEMRVVVDALRDEAPYTPSNSIENLEELVDGFGPAVSIERRGDLSDLTPQVSAALYRLAQESITNARRHAPDATSIDVTVDGSSQDVRLDVVNDGAQTSHRNDYEGFGLIGMNERATLLGGSFRAGPLPDGGWATTAELPRGGRTRSTSGGQ